MKLKIGFLMAEGGATASLKTALELVNSMQVGHETAVVNALFPPEAWRARLRELEQSGAKVIVTVGASPVAAVMAEAFSAAPVVEADAAVEVAAMRALRILAMADPDLADRLVAWRKARGAQMGAEDGREVEPSAAKKSPTSRKEIKVSVPKESASNDDADMAELARLEREFAQNSASRKRSRKGSGATAEKDKNSAAHEQKPTLPQSLRYTPSAQAVFGAARELAQSREGMEVGAIHFLGGILKSPITAAYTALREMGVKPALMLEQVERMLPARRTSSGGVLALGDGAEEMLKRAKDSARNAGRRWVTTTDLLSSMLRAVDDRGGALLSAHGIQAHALEALVRDGRLPDEIHEAEEAEPVSNQPEPPTEYDEEQLTRTEAMLREKLGGGLTAEGASAEVEATSVPPRPTELEPPLERLQPLDEDAPQRVVTDAQNPQLDVLEVAMGALLEGRIVALPTETSYMLAVDSTNRDAIRRLFTLTDRDPGAPVGVLVHSTKQLRHMVRGFTPQLMHLTERFWPGPLTVVMERHPRSFPGVSRDSTLGIRIPDNYLALALLSLIGRPLAAVTADLTTGEPAVTAQQVGESYPVGIGLIVDAGQAGKLPAPTVVSVLDSKWQVLREGAIPRVELDEVIPDGVKLED
jgi:L-threonylcarbamoyladenylate synthase